MNALNNPASEQASVRQDWHAPQVSVLADIDEDTLNLAAGDFDAAGFS